MDNGPIGSVISALSIGKMISTPPQVMIAAQTPTAKSYVDFLLQVYIQNGKAVTVQFDYDETIVDEKGVTQGTIQKTMCISLLCVIAHPVIVTEGDTIDFELEITQSEKSPSTIEVEGSFQVKFGWGPFSVSMSGRVSHKPEQTRGTDTCAKYSFHTQVKCQSPPEAPMCVMEFLTDAAAKPVVVKGKENDVKPLSTMPTDGTMIDEKVPAGGNALAPAPAIP